MLNEKPADFIALAYRPSLPPLAGKILFGLTRGGVAGDQQRNKLRPFFGVFYSSRSACLHLHDNASINISQNIEIKPR